MYTCNGSTHYEMTDAYDSHTWPCPGPDKCGDAARRLREKEAPVISKAEAREMHAEAITQRLPQPSGGAAVKVSIPVRVGGYTGQRDAWEELERDYVVSVQGDDIVLLEAATPRRKITIPRAGLESALKILEQYT